MPKLSQVQRDARMGGSERSSSSPWAYRNSSGSDRPFASNPNLGRACSDQASSPFLGRQSTRRCLRSWVRPNQDQLEPTIVPGRNNGDRSFPVDVRVSYPRGRMSVDCNRRLREDRSYWGTSYCRSGTFGHTAMEPCDLSNPSCQSWIGEFRQDSEVRETPIEVRVQVRPPVPCTVLPRPARPDHVGRDVA